MKNRLFILRTIIVAVSLTTPMASNAMQNLQALDTNNDGQVSAAEVKAGMTALFAKIDTNSDGYITLTESEVWRESAGSEHFNNLDTDKNASLSLAEFQAGAPSQDTSGISARLFNLLDIDKNSALGWDEFSVMEPGKGETLRRFAEMDNDSDSKISQAEFLAQRSHQPGPPHGAPKK